MKAVTVASGGARSVAPWSSSGLLSSVVLSGRTARSWGGESGISPRPSCLLELGSRGSGRVFPLIRSERAAPEAAPPPIRARGAGVSSFFGLAGKGNPAAPNSVRMGKGPWLVATNEGATVCYLSTRQYF